MHSFHGFVHLPFLIPLRIVTFVAADGHDPMQLQMLKLPVRALLPVENESCALEFSDQFANLARHCRLCHAPTFAASLVCSPTLTLILPVRSSPMICRRSLS